MKTKLVRPIFIDVNDIKTSIVMKGVMPNLCRLTTDVIDDEEWLRFGKPQQLILFSLDPDEKIEVANTLLLDNEIVVCTGFGKTPDIIKINDRIEPYIHKSHFKKVIATQDQLSPEHIQQLVDEYNNGGMQDFEIEITNEPQTDSDLKELLAGKLYLNKPKLTNGFVTVVDTVIGKPLDDYIKEKHSQDRCMGFIDGYNARKSEESINYTKEEVKVLLDNLKNDFSYDYLINFPTNFINDWFNENKKK